MYGGAVYAGTAIAGAGMADADIPQDATEPTLAVEVSFTTGALETPQWVDITGDVRSWDVTRGRSRELERMQPGRATVVLSNLSRQYDSSHATGPWFGNIRPMRRMRIRETFNGVTYPTFDGYVDRWQLDYPGTGKDATATVTATDGFKILVRTDLPPSVYFDEVEGDSPLLWWRLGEPYALAIEERVALNQGTAGTAGDGTYVGAINAGAAAMIVNDPSTALQLANPDVVPATPRSGVEVPATDLNVLQRMNDLEPFALEFWCRPDNEGGNFTLFFQDVDTATIQVAWDNADLQAGRFTFFTLDDFAGGQTLRTPDGSNPPGFIYHLVVTSVPQGSDALVKIYVDGVEEASATFADAFTVGTVVTSSVGTSNIASSNWNGTIADVAAYLPASGDPLPVARISAHYAAGTAPWQGDDGGARATRILDVAGWPADLRELDDLAEALQSATLTGQTTLEHLQKAADSEFGLLFMSRDGKVRLISRANIFARTSQATVGDGAGEVGYRAISFDDGDQVIRNRATISRLNGVAKTDEDAASVDEFGRFDYVLDGLLHRLDAHSLAYADFVVAEYHEPRRRVTDLDLGPPAGDDAAAFYPAVLGRELGEQVRVKQGHAPGGGEPFTQESVVEGMQHSGTPKVRTARFILSPEFTTSF